MGILGLAKLIADVAPSSFKQGEIKQYFGKFRLYRYYIFVILL